MKIRVFSHYKYKRLPSPKPVNQSSSATNISSALPSLFHLKKFHCAVPLHSLIEWNSSGSSNGVSREFDCVSLYKDMYNWNLIYTRSEDSSHVYDQGNDSWMFFIFFIQMHRLISLYTACILFYRDGLCLFELLIYSLISIAHIYLP